MSASRLCSLLGPTSSSTMAFRNPNSLSSFSLLRFATKPSFSTKTLHFRSYAVPAIAAEAETAIESLSITTVSAAVEPNRNLHPWPEWVSFVDRLKSQGYFPQSSSASRGGDAELVYRDMKLVKEPILSFARDRYDIFWSLSKGDIQAIVEGGCPKILRKVINSAKRLRVYVGLVESDVCSACSLQGSCDRAYLTLTESEQDARTVDLVRLLLFYALDPLVMPEAVGSQQVDHANSSARKLLRMLTDLSEASPGLAPVHPSAKDSYHKKQIAPSKNPVVALNTAEDSFQKKKIVPSKNSVVAQSAEIRRGDWVCPECSFMNFSKNVQCRKCDAEKPEGESAYHGAMKRDWVAQNSEMKKGDWVCPECSFMNFSRNAKCRKCDAENPKGEISNQVEMKRGDWNCPQCSFMNFSRNVRCRKCSAENPKGESSHQVEMKRGDWNCPQCGCMNFASRRNCFECKEPRPPRNLNPGEWECPKCDFLNFRRNIACLKCGTEKVKEAVSQYEEQFWRRPQ